MGSAAFAYGLNNIGFSFATSPLSEVIFASAIGLVFTGIATTAIRNEFFRNNNDREHNQHQQPPVIRAPVGRVVRNLNPDIQVVPGIPVEIAPPATDAEITEASRLDRRAPRGR